MITYHTIPSNRYVTRFKHFLSYLFIFNIHLPLSLSLLGLQFDRMENHRTKNENIKHIVNKLPVKRIGGKRETGNYRKTLWARVAWCSIFKSSAYLCFFFGQLWIILNISNISNDQCLRAVPQFYLNLIFILWFSCNSISIFQYIFFLLKRTTLLLLPKRKQIFSFSWTHSAA